MPCSGASKPVRVIVFPIIVRIEEGSKYSNKMEVKKLIINCKKKKKKQQPSNCNKSIIKMLVALKVMVLRMQRYLNT